MPKHTDAEIKAGLEGGAKLRGEAKELKEEGTDILRRWLPHVPESKKMTMVTAAKVAKVSEVSAWAMAKKTKK